MKKFQQIKKKCNLKRLEEINITNKKIDNTLKFENENNQKVEKEINGKVFLLKQISDDLNYINRFIHAYEKKKNINL